MTFLYDERRVDGTNDVSAFEWLLMCGWLWVNGFACHRAWQCRLLQLPNYHHNLSCITPLRLIRSHRVLSTLETSNILSINTDGDGGSEGWSCNEWWVTMLYNWNLLSIDESIPHRIAVSRSNVTSIDWHENVLYQCFLAYLPYVSATDIVDKLTEKLTKWKINGLNAKY